MVGKGIRETITFSCDPEFKELIKLKVKDFGYKNKSHMIRDALRNFFESEKSLDNIEDDVKITVIISIVYNHHDLKTVQQLLEAQHSSDISYSYHHHMQDNECLENLIAHDDAKTVRILLRDFRAIPGLKYISIQVVSQP